MKDPRSTRPPASPPIPAGPPRPAPSPAADAAGSTPSVAGEEDPGAALDTLVTPPADAPRDPAAPAPSAPRPRG